MIDTHISPVEMLFHVHESRFVGAIAMTTSAPAAPGTIPYQRSPLVGRALELGQIGAILASGSDRLITLTGPGGVGKTRLAIEVAARVHAAGGQAPAFLPLAHIDNAEAV